MELNMPPPEQIIFAPHQFGTNFRIQIPAIHTRRTVVRILKKIYRTLWADGHAGVSGASKRKGLFASDQFYLSGTQDFYIPLVNIGLDSDNPTAKDVYSHLIRSRQNVTCIPMKRYFYFVSNLRHEKKKALFQMGWERATAFVPGGDFENMAQQVETGLNAVSSGSDAFSGAMGYRDAAKGLNGVSRMIKLFAQHAPARPDSDNEMSINQTQITLHKELGGTLSHCILEFDGNLLRFITVDGATFQSLQVSDDAKRDPFLFKRAGFENHIATSLTTDGSMTVLGQVRNINQ